MDNRWHVYKDGDRVEVVCEVVGSGAEISLRPIGILDKTITGDHMSQYVRKEDFVKSHDQ